MGIEHGVVVPLAHATGWTAQIPVGMVVLAGAAYLWTARRARGPSPKRSRTVFRARRRAVAFFGGLLAVLVALSGPVERFADDLFWVHMVQHLLLLTVAAPLFVLAAAWVLPLRLLRPDARRRAVARWRGPRSTRPLQFVAAFLAVPTAVWIVFNVNLVVWHIPAAFDLTLRSAPVHDLEHLLFLGLGVLFWAQVIESPPLHSRLGHLQRAMYVGAAAIVGWALSIALTLAPSALYAPYGELAARPGGLSGLADQRLAAGVMLVPGSIAFALVAALTLTRWLAEDEPRAAPRAGYAKSQIPRGAEEEAASWVR
jgi:cytochrome c oxidase assembly factor CtaG